MLASQNFANQLDEREETQTVAGDQSQPKSKWSEFPPELLITVAKLLSTSKNTSVSCKHQILRFRAVCKPWRSGLSYHHKYDDTPVSPFIPRPIRAPPQSLNLNPPSSYYYNSAPEPKVSFYLVYSTAYVLKSSKDPSKSHFIVVDHLSDESGKVCCRKPLSVAHDRSCNWDINSPRSINLLDYRVLVVSEDYTLRKLVRDENRLFQLPISCENFCKKAVVILNPESKEKSDGIVLVLFDDGKLGEYSIKDKKWETIYDGKKTKCSDMIRYKAGCIVIDHKANAYRIDCDIVSGSLSWNQIAGEVLGSRKRRKRLVLEPDGDLYMIAQDTLPFVTHKLSDGTWRGRKRWGPYAVLLVGLDFSCFAEIKAFSTLANCWGRAKCLIFNKRSFPLYKDKDFDPADKLYNRTGPHELYVDEYMGGARPVFMPCESYEHDFSFMFSSPSKWGELTPPQALPCMPQCLNEQQATPRMGCESVGNLGVQSLRSEDEYAASESTIPSEGNYCDISHGKTVLKGKGKRMADDANHLEPDVTSRSKSRKIMPSQPAGDISEVELGGVLGSIQNLLAAITRLIDKPIRTQPETPGCSLREVIQDLGSLPGVKAGSDFYFSSALHLLLKEHRELYMCLESADIKFKWLQYMCNHYRSTP